MATDDSNSQSSKTTLKRKSSSDFDTITNHDKLKSIWMDIIAEKAGDDSDAAFAMIQQLPNILLAFDKAVEKGYITFVSGDHSGGGSTPPSQSSSSTAPSTAATNVSALPAPVATTTTHSPQSLSTSPPPPPTVASVIKSETPQSSSELTPPPEKVQKIIYDKVIYVPTWIFKKWNVTSLDTDFTIKDLEFRPYPKAWFKQEQQHWKKETQLALIVHNEWQSSKITEIATKISECVDSFKIIIQSNRKDATEFCQNLFTLGIKVAICSTANECERALQSIEPGLPKTRIPVNAIPLRDINTQRPPFRSRPPRYFLTPQNGRGNPSASYRNVGHPQARNFITPLSYRNTTPSPSFSSSLTPTTSLGSAFIYPPQSYYYQDGSNSSSYNYHPSYYHND